MWSTTQKRQIDKNIEKCAKLSINYIHVATAVDQSVDATNLFIWKTRRGKKYLNGPE